MEKTQIESLAATTDFSGAQTRVDAGENKSPETSANKHFDSSYQSLLFGSAGTLAKPAWSDSTKGRLAIRMFSRGIMGAALFTIGGRISRTQLIDYNPRTFELNWATIKEKPLQAIAKGFDEVFGKPIAGIARMRVNTKGLTEKAANLAKANAEWDATMFRTASYYHSSAGKQDHKGRPMNGRSLGAEIVAVSFDFAMMSVGDGAGRNLVQMIDPNIRKTWMLNDKGQKAKEGEKSHFSATKFVQSWGRSAWRIISKNQGEDWVVALPYVYQMRMQRKILSKAFGDTNGTKLVFDHAWNGGAYKVNNAGQIVGDHQLAGAVDLHFRFVGYNVLTLMFREGYDALGNHLKHWKENGYGMHLHLPQHVDPIRGVTDAVRYGVKSFIKANLYMNPAVIPFWLMRVPQTKWRGALVNTEAALGTNAIISESSFTARLGDEAKKLGTTSEELLKKTIMPRDCGTINHNYSSAENRVTGKSLGTLKIFYSGDTPITNRYHGVSGPNDWKLYADYKKGFATNFSKALNPFGQFSYWLGGKATNLLHALPEGKVKNLIGLEDASMIAHYGNKAESLISSAKGRETFARNFVDASLAYTPYFFTKSELGLRVDDTPSTGGRGKMDNAIYKFIDNVCALNPHKTGASVKEIWHLSTHRDKVVMREGNANNPDQRPISNNSGKPSTLVHAEGRVKDANAGLSTTVSTKLYASSDKRWAESVSGKASSANFGLDGLITRH